MLTVTLHRMISVREQFLCQVENPLRIRRMVKEYAGQTDYTHPHVLVDGKRLGWADPEDVGAIDFSTRRSYSGDGRIHLGPDGRPLNPYRTSAMIRGRGWLGHWGANFAADPLITCTDEDGALHVLLIKRPTGEWAYPGGFVDYGELATVTAVRELCEETGMDETAAQNILRSGKILHQGIVDDPRSTQNAWTETTVVHAHIADADALRLRLDAGDDAQDVRWAKVRPELFKELIDVHHAFLLMALETLISDGRIQAREYETCFKALGYRFP